MDGTRRYRRVPSSLTCLPTRNLQVLLRNAILRQALDCTQRAVLR